MPVDILFTLCPTIYCRALSSILELVQYLRLNSRLYAWKQKSRPEKSERETVRGDSPAVMRRQNGDIPRADVILLIFTQYTHYYSFYSKTHLHIATN